MAAHSSILAWRIPRTEEPGRLESMALQRVGHNLATKQQNNNNLLKKKIKHLYRASLTPSDQSHWDFSFYHG